MQRPLAQSLVVLLLLCAAAAPWVVVLDTLEALVLGADADAVCTTAALPLRRPRELEALASAMEAGPPPRRLA